MTHNSSDTVSVIIPCYNSAGFIRDTLGSILEQDYPHLEIIIVNDGSQDDTERIISEIKDDRIQYIYQANAGVAKARNQGLLRASGRFVIFFDADDKMGHAFISSRVATLQAQPYQFVCGMIETFPVEGPALAGVATNIPKTLLHYLPGYSTCPSNYLIERSVLQRHGISFNERLSSTADRFFLLQLDRVAKGVLIKQGHLLYRVSPDSMSNRLSLKLINDNEMFLRFIREEGLAPQELRSYFYYRIYYILGLGFLKVGNTGTGLKYLCRIVARYPLLFVRDLIRRFR